MIQDLRYIERPCVAFDGTIYETRKILQAYDGHVWFDVPLVQQALTEEEEK